MQMGIFIFLAAVLLIPGLINYGLMTGHKGPARYISTAFFIASPLVALIYVYFHHQQIDALAAKDLIGWSDYDDEDMGDFVLLIFAVPMLASGILSTLIALVAGALKHRKRHVLKES